MNLNPAYDTDEFLLPPGQQHHVYKADWEKHPGAGEWFHCGYCPCWKRQTYADAAWPDHCDDCKVLDGATITLMVAVGVIRGEAWRRNSISNPWWTK